MSIRGLKKLLRPSWLVVGMVGGLAACSGQHDQPNYTYMPDMHYSPALKAQEAQVGANGKMRTPPEGTLARGMERYAYPNDPEAAGRNLKNPYPRSAEILKRGQDLYNVYCIVCHGKFGEGDGSVVPKFPRPPSLQSEKVQGWSDGRIYHVITEGQNLMPSYASQIDVKERWKVIHYVRVLQRAKNPTSQDLEKLKNW